MTQKVNFVKEFIDNSNYAKQLYENFSETPNSMEMFSILTELLILQQKKALITLLKSGQQNKCLARIHNGSRCGRKCHSDKVLFCGTHLTAMPYGRMDQEPLTNDKLIEKKTRGRKAKNKISIDLDQIDLSLYIKTEQINIDGKDYLIDKNDIVFEMNNTNTIVAKKLNNGTYEWF